jgi:hypothetical protein
VSVLIFKDSSTPSQLDGSQHHCCCCCMTRTNSGGILSHVLTFCEEWRHQLVWNVYVERIKIAPWNACCCQSVQNCLSAGLRSKIIRIKLQRNSQLCMLFRMGVKLGLSHYENRMRVSENSAPRKILVVKYKVTRAIGYNCTMKLQIA